MSSSGPAFAATKQQFIDQVRNEYLGYEKKMSAAYQTFQEGSAKKYEDYKKYQTESFERFARQAEQDAQKLDKWLSQDLESVTKQYRGDSAKLRDYTNKINPNYLSSPMQQYTNSTNPNYLGSFMMNYKNAVNENYLNSPMMKFKNAVNENYLNSPMMKYKNAVNANYLNSPMFHLKNGSNTNYLNSIMYKYNRGSLSQQEAVKQWGELYKTETQAIQNIGNRSMEEIKQTEAAAKEAIFKQKCTTVQGILDQRKQTLETIAKLHQEYFGEEISFEPLIPDLGEINVLLNGEWLCFEQPPTQINGSTLVPMRTIFEKLGVDVTWHQETSSITATKGSTKISLTIDKPTATVNGQTITLGTPPRLINSYTMVPIRFVSESLGAEVNWDEGSKTVFITLKESD
ncbi:copper amine oxidase N-terminal domain-containing protein [Brevibacillus sp. B_LB10_24]|uniref:copper amine oxidase N-terminal domain-containing protein n=1 Tax=Brevibacillus sp. B_LB10_24 TaxID=3380645 RepID=UPI0038BA462E